MVVHSLLTKRRLDNLKKQVVDIPEVLQWLCKVRGMEQTGPLCAYVLIV